MRSSLTMIVFTMFVACGSVEGEDISTTPTGNITTEVEKPVTEDKHMYQWTYADPVEVNLDDMPFQEAFRIQHHAKGPGHTFWWNGDEYTTDLQHVGIGNGQWVRNSSDTDDYCRSNTWDECGTCNGNGPKTWYIDRDGDGLGDPNTFKLSCYYPSVDEE